MTKTFASQAASLVAAALFTLAIFSGTSAIAGHAYRDASIAQLKSQDVTVAVQHVTIVGRRPVRA
jgi:hypothetical protein